MKTRVWIFRVGTAVTAGNLLLFFVVKESRPSLLLEREIKKLQSVTGDLGLQAQNPDHMPDFQTFCRVALVRPFRLFFTDPLIVMVSAMSALSWGLIYLFTGALPFVYGLFGFTESQSSLFFLAIAIGILFSIFPRIITIRKMDSLQQSGQRVQPEDKIIGVHFASPALAIGLWIFAWTIPPSAAHVHWIVSSIGLALAGFAANEIAYTLGAYISDTYTIFAASAFATLSFFRAIVSGVLTLVAGRMFADLGPNIAGTLLASLATSFCIFPFVFSKYGQTLRERSEFAKYSVAVNLQTQVEED
jgi:hypothetical protein